MPGFSLEDPDIDREQVLNLDSQINLQQCRLQKAEGERGLKGKELLTVLGRECELSVWTVKSSYPAPSVCRQLWKGLSDWSKVRGLGKLAGET